MNSNGEDMFSGGPIYCRYGIQPIVYMYNLLSHEKLRQSYFDEGLQIQKVKGRPERIAAINPLIHIKLERTVGA